MRSGVSPCRSSADFQVCCIADFQSACRCGFEAIGGPGTLWFFKRSAGWKHAIQQVRKPALPKIWLASLLILVAVFFFSRAIASPQPLSDDVLASINFDQKLGTQVSLDLTFTD